MGVLDFTAVKHEIVICDLCGQETEWPKTLKVPEASIKRDLCAECLERLRIWLQGVHASSNIHTIYEHRQKDLETILRQGAEALEHYASGATADDLAAHIRDMVSGARREMFNARAAG